MSGKIHPSITTDRIMDAVHRQTTSTDNPGFCVGCGVEVEGVEPDAREYECEECGERKVFGAEQCLIEFV